MKTIVYVDGFNLYYGCLRKTPYKWLDLYELFKNHLLIPDTDLVEIKYFTAPIKALNQANKLSPWRQQQYWRALNAYSGDAITIIQGIFQRTTPYAQIVRPIEAAPELEKVKVHKIEEKKTDVNLAVHLLSDAWKERYDQAVICQ